jgi:protein-S-isoprenylcysteine O-methyltransferase Ste14
MTTGDSDHSEDRHGPNVRVHPPIIFAISILAGIGLNNLWELEMPLGVHGRVYGGVIIFLATLIAAWSLLKFHKAQTDVRPDKPDSALITTGPYRYSRNPLYIVLTLAQITTAVWLNNLWILLLVLPSILAVTRYAIEREERYLEKLFGQHYLDYKQRVRRWF